MKKLYEKMKSEKQIITFHGIEGSYTVYNATPPLWIKVFGQTKRVIVGRVEKTDEWAHSHISFFERLDDSNYNLIDGLHLEANDIPNSSIEDPSLVTINEEIILSVVIAKCTEIKPSMDTPEDAWKIKTQYYRGDDLNKLTVFAEIDGKDNRICPIDNNNIIVAMRPQGCVGGLGQIGFIETTLDELENIEWGKAHLLSDLFHKDEWGGVNELHFNTKNPELIGALCHTSFEYAETNDKVYFSFWMVYNRKTQKSEKVLPLAIRRDFLETSSKYERLKNVHFPSGIEFLENEAPRLHSGLGDYAQGFITIHKQEVIDFYN